MTETVVEYNANNEVGEESKAIEPTSDKTKKRNKRTDDELLLELENQIKSIEERKKRVVNRKKEIEKRRNEKERKERTRRLIEIGEDFATVFPNEYKDIDHNQFIKYLEDFKRAILNRCIKKEPTE